MLRNGGLGQRCDHVKEKRLKHHCDQVKEKRLNITATTLSKGGKRTSTMRRNSLSFGDLWTGSYCVIDAYTKISYDVRSNFVQSMILLTFPWL
jgi:hypothetical protein